MFPLKERLVPGEKYMLYEYEPSKVAPIIFIALFGITTAIHTFQLVRRRTWYFIPFVIGGLFEVIGYVGRALNARQSYGNWTTPPYIMQSLLILLAPALFAASIYMVLGRLITLLAAEHLSPIRVKWLTKVFVTGDVISFLAQSAGGGMLSQAKTQSKVNLGENIITGGLGVQVLFFFCFIVVSGIFNVRLHRNPTQRSETIGWQSYLYILYLASSLIMIRSVFRMIEYAMGQDGILLQHEVFLYVFDAALMFLAMVLFNFYHPSTIVKSDKKRDAESHDSGLELMEERGQHIRSKVMDSKV